MTEQILVPRMATINEASEITGLAKYFIRQLAVTGKIRTIKAGKKYLINVDKLIDYLNNSGDNEAESDNNTPTIRRIEK